MPAKGKSLSTPGEASTAERLIKPMRGKSPRRLWRQMCKPGGAAPHSPGAAGAEAGEGVRGLGRAQEGRSRAEDSSGPLPCVHEDRGPSAALARLRTVLAVRRQLVL